MTGKYVCIAETIEHCKTQLDALESSLKKLNQALSKNNEEDYVYKQALCNIHLQKLMKDLERLYQVVNAKRDITEVGNNVETGTAIQG